ncbi:MAG: DUF1989 domain-containing protein [Alphaproteobacteria bacterium]|jgi:uncharacterized protein YcgI (DUF1989 family)
MQALVKAAQGYALGMAAGDRVRIINTTGTQVVDTWAFAADEQDDLLSMEHCREVLQKITFDVGDVLITNLYRPILEILDDTSGGGHDTLIAACSSEMYARAGAVSDHPSCAANLKTALAGDGRICPVTPAPWNLFMLAPVRDGQAIDYVRPTCPPGGFVEVKALIDCLMVFSACPDDVYPTNGGDGSPRDVALEVIRQSVTD